MNITALKPINSLTRIPVAYSNSTSLYPDTQNDLMYGEFNNISTSCKLKTLGRDLSNCGDSMMDSWIMFSYFFSN